MTLARSTSLRRSAMPRRGKALRRTKLAPVSKKGRAKAAVWAKVCAARLAFCGGRCEMCGTLAHLHGHHRLPRSQGGKNVDGNCVMLCERCHSHVHAHPEGSYRSGWLLRREQP